MNTRFMTCTVIIMLAQALAGCGSSNSSSPSSPSMPLTPPPPPPATSLAGNYFVTFEADPSCGQFPERFKTRTYEASISYRGGGTAGSDAWFHAYLQGARFVDLQGWGQSFMIKVTDDFVYFDFSDSFIVEKPEPETYLTIAGGEGGATVDWSNLSTMSASFYGAFLYCVTNSDVKFPGECPDAIRNSACRSKNSRWTLTRK